MSFFVAAYAALWAAVFGYLLWLGSRLHRLREETRALASASASPSGPPATPRPPEPPARDPADAS